MLFKKKKRKVHIETWPKNTRKKFHKRLKYMARNAWQSSPLTNNKRKNFKRGYSFQP
jgi:hypothetical protein